MKKIIPFLLLLAGGGLQAQTYVSKKILISLTHRFFLLCNYSTVVTWRLQGRDKTKKLMKNGIRITSFLFFFISILNAQTEIQFQEGPWENIPCQDCKDSERKITSKQFSFWCGETLLGVWSLKKIASTDDEIVTFSTESGQAAGIGDSEFRSDTLAMLDIFQEVRHACQQGRELKRRPTEHTDYALFIIQNFFTPFPESDVLDVVLRSADEMPRFPGCEDMEASVRDKKKCADKEMLEFVYRNYRYPAEARRIGVEGTVVISFIIEKNGMVSDPKIVRDIGGGCGEEALRVVRLMQEQSIRWTPARQNGQPVRCMHNLPVKFKLN